MWTMLHQGEVVRKSKDAREDEVIQKSEDAHDNEGGYGHNWKMHRDRRRDLRDAFSEKGQLSELFL